MEIFAWCIMSSHVHLVFQSIEGQKPELLLGDFKRHTSKEIIKSIKENPRESRREILLEQFEVAGTKTSNVKNYQFWRHDNKPIELWTPKVINQKIIRAAFRYVHNNPVEEGVVFEPQDYKYSSAIDYAGGIGLLDNICIFEYFEI
jgi:REP element-mobilizing transposase RayT